VQTGLCLFLLHSAHSRLYLKIEVDSSIFPMCTLMFYLQTQTFNSQKRRLPETCSNV
jgi:hypothetical protein